MNNQVQDTTIPLVADLDGTLIDTDLLFEALILLIKKNPLYIFTCFLWVFKGRAYLKAKVFALVQIQYELLPYNTAVLEFLQAEFAKGRKIILATASPYTAAMEVAKVHPLFSEVYGSTNDINLKSAAKLNLLVKNFGDKQFDYIGNSSADLVIFASSRNAYLANASKTVERKAKKIATVTVIAGLKKLSLKDYIKAIRAYQWIKNLLLFVPLVTSHSYGSVKLLTLSFFGFCIFSLVASAGYLLNDLLDLNADRKHPRKKFRPVASGKIAIPTAVITAVLFLAAGLFFAAQLNWWFLCIVIFYFITSFSYSLFLKRIVLYDVFILALLYSVRVFAGAIVIDVVLSFWLIAFSTFIFLSLAFVKRYSELIQLIQSEGETNLKDRGRGYIVQDINLLQVMGIASGFLAVVVFSLYINSPEITQLYSKPRILWAISFLFLFWISRIWLFTTRGKMTDDPIVFALKDVTSYFVFLITGVLILLASI
ncbi:UbiA family prenyltransferase [Ferruginibacter sp. SUN106]|uniref:UbiA family prenyltransferase n=1 Tax=Ferruginibacter sp. SUN106 TaxID=2978348 RepID=UPI003D36C028